jgi:hypothetical protein
MSIALRKAVRALAPEDRGLLGYAENVSWTKEGDGGVPLTVHAQGIHLARLRCAAPAGQHAAIFQGNGYVAEDCIFDGDAAAHCLRLAGDPDDDDFTASEGIIRRCSFRYGLKGLVSCRFDGSTF